MKLSAAIEHALVSGEYANKGCYFMCIALGEKSPHVVDVQKLVKSIFQGTPRKDYPLFCALTDAGYDMSPCSDSYTTQLYVWWVYDLKRKGL